MSYLQRLEDTVFAEHVWTDDLTLEQVADRVATASGLELRPAEHWQARTALRRTATTVRHMRGLCRESEPKVGDCSGVPGTVKTVGAALHPLPHGRDRADSDSYPRVVNRG